MPNVTSVEEIKHLRRQLGEDTINLVSTALAVGWRAQYTNSGQGIAIIAPGIPSPKRYNFTSQRSGDGDRESLFRSILRYGDQRKVKRLKSAAETAPTQEDFMEVFDGQVKGTMLMEDVEDGKIVAATPVPKLGAFGQVVEDKPYKNPGKSMGEVLTTEEVKALQPYVVTERPAMMHLNLSQQGGKSYPSETSVERRWSDGHVDYRCAVETCDTTSENRRSFGGRHWQNHVNAGEAENISVVRAKSLAVLDPNYTERAFEKGPSQRTFDKSKLIAGILNNITDWKDLSVGDLAEKLAAALFTGTESDEPVNFNPPTPEAILDRIRRLVDGGHYAKQEQAIEEAAIQLQELQSNTRLMRMEHDERLAAVAARAERAEGNLRALKELITEVPDGD